MYIVYILFSQKDKNLYVGCTTNIFERLKLHNQGSVISTRNRRPLELIYTEEYQNKGDAFQRERFLKSLWSARFKRKIKEQYINNKKTR